MHSEAIPAGVSPYLDHVRRQEMEYLVSYEEFEAGLTAEQRAMLQSSGAAAPDIEFHKTMNSRRITLGLDRDVAESSAASLGWDAEVLLEDPIDVWMDEIPGLNRRQAEEIEARLSGLVERAVAERACSAIISIASAFLDSKNVRLQAAGLAFAAGLPVVGGAHSMQEFASANGVSRQAISKSAKFWQRELKLPPGPHMREEHKCDSYRQAQLTKNHWHNKDYEPNAETD